MSYWDHSDSDSITAGDSSIDVSYFSCLENKAHFLPSHSFVVFDLTNQQLPVHTQNRTTMKGNHFQPLLDTLVVLHFCSLELEYSV